MFIYIKNNYWENIVSKVSRSANIATVETSEDHNLSVNNKIKISCDDATYDISDGVVISVIDSTHFTYGNIGEDESEKSATGYVGLYKSWTGQEIEPNTYYTIEESEEFKWAHDNAVLIDVANSKLIVNNGTEDVLDIYSAFEVLANDIPTNVSSTGEPIPTWTQLKTFYDTVSKVASLNYFDFGTYYYIWLTYRDQKFFTPMLTKNTEDGDDFEANYKSKCNVPEFPRIRNTTCKAGRRLHLRFISFTTADQNNMDNTDWAEQDFGDLTYIMKDLAGNTTTVNADAKETWLALEPMFNYEIIGGRLFIPAILGERSLSISSIIQSAGVATVTSIEHKLKVNSMITITGANQPEYNGLKRVVSIVDADTFTYAIASDTISPATGTITAVEGDDAWELHTIAAPDIPAAFGGSIIFIANSRVKHVKGQWLDADSALNPAEMIYDANYHTNKLLFVFKHPVGVKSEFQILVKMFK
jgi:hypothetical protein